MIKACSARRLTHKTQGPSHMSGQSSTRSCFLRGGRVHQQWRLVFTHKQNFPVRLWETAMEEYRAYHHIHSQDKLTSHVCRFRFLLLLLRGRRTCQPFRHVATLKHLLLPVTCICFATLLLQWPIHIIGCSQKQTFMLCTCLRTHCVLTVNVPAFVFLFLQSHCIAQCPL